jgi:hypothetical protein
VSEGLSLEDFRLVPCEGFEDSSIRTSQAMAWFRDHLFVRTGRGPLRPMGLSPEALEEYPLLARLAERRRSRRNLSIDEMAVFDGCRTSGAGWRSRAGRPARLAGLAAPVPPARPLDDPPREGRQPGTSSPAPGASGRSTRAMSFLGASTQ